MIRESKPIVGHARDPLTRSIAVFRPRKPPDDENNAVLVRLSRGEGVRTALLTLTRGEGGQNAVGPELGPALGVLRTEELMEVHRYDGVEQYFGRAYEFGFSFSVEESFQKWGREETLGDVVRVVRAFRPDVIVTLPLEAAGGGAGNRDAGGPDYRALQDGLRLVRQEPGPDPRTLEEGDRALGKLGGGLRPPSDGPRGTAAAFAIRRRLRGLPPPGTLPCS